MPIRTRSERGPRHATAPSGSKLRAAALLAAASLLLAACARPAEGPPRLVVDRSVCTACSMLVSEPAFAGAYRLDGRERVFDDLGCLVAALAAEEAPGEARVWVHDLDTRRWLPAGAVVYVHSPSLHTPMGSGLAALGDPAAAEELATRTGGRVIPGFAELLEERTDVE